MRLAGEASILRHLRPWLQEDSANDEEAGGECLVLFPLRGPDGAPLPRETRRLAAELRPDRVLLISSTEVQPPLYSQPGLAAARKARALAGRHPFSDPWCRLEMELGEQLAATGTPLRILRAAPTPHRGGRDPWSRRFHRWITPTAMGFDPPVQLLHGEDLAAAIRLAVRRFEQLPTVLQAVPGDAVPLRQALRRAGVRRLPVPFSWQWIACSLARRLGRPESPAALDGLRYTFTASGSVLAALGFKARWSAASAAAAASADPGEPQSGAGEDERFDPFGLDATAIHRLRRTVIRFLRAIYWRVDVRGSEHLPTSGPWILLGVHRGIVPFDAILALDAVVAATGRVPRFLIHPALLRFPFIGDLMRRLGGVVACRENAEWVLEGGGVLGLFPEGVKGAFSPYRDAYHLHRFGRAEFARLAMRHRAPLALFVTLGSAEVFPVLATYDWKAWKRWSGWPSFPLLASPLPLPVKWHTRFLPTLSPEEMAEGAAEAGSRGDRRTAKRLSDEVRRRLEEQLLSMKARRRSWFWGELAPRRQPEDGEDAPAELDHAREKAEPQSSEGHPT